MLEARVTRGGFETIHGPKDGHGEVGMGMKRMHVEHVAGMRNLVAQRKVWVYRRQQELQVQGRDEQA